MSLVECLHSPSHLLLLQSSIAQSSLPILHHLLAQNNVKKYLFCFLHLPPSPRPTNLEIHDFLDCIPDYSKSWADILSKILNIVQQAPASLPIEVAMDSVDTLFEDSGSTLETIQFLKALVTAISSRPKPSRLILHICSPSKILPLIVSTSFSPSITHLIAHPPVLITHLAEEYMTPPPPLSPDVKFWGLFIPISERNRDTESLIFGPGGDGSGGHSEMVVEAIVRGGQDVSGRRKAAERFLEGWDLDQSRPVPLSQLRTLASIWKRKVVTEEAAPHSAQDILFNLHLTPSQQESRAQVPLPYAHQGHIFTQPAAGAILYDPDSADDIDDDDPDEDLDI